MRLIKPLTLSVLTRPFLHRGRHRLGVGALAFFDITPGAPATLRPEAEIWSFLADRLDPAAPFDVGMPKSSAEVVVFGDAIAPDGAPARWLDVTIEISGATGRILDKALRVFGDRRWTVPPEGGDPSISPPEPFTRMPLTWERTFGGPAFPANPLGRGHDAVRRFDGGEAVLLPNVEDRRQQGRAYLGDTRRPCILGPIEATWPDRKAKAGTYDEQWLEADFPGLAPDVDWAMFNVAQPDQWIDGWLAGDERFAVGGMNQSHAVVRGSLPGMGCRCFVESAGEIREITLRNETLCLFPNDMKAVLIARGVVDVRRPDAEDIVTLLLAYERMSDERRSAGHYAEVVRLRSDPATRHLYALADSQITPRPSAEEASRRDAARRHAREAAAAGQRERTEALVRRIISDNDRPAPAAVADALRRSPGTPPGIGDIPVVSDADIAAHDVDLAGLVTAVDRAGREARALADARRAEAEERRSAVEARRIERAGSRAAYDAAQASEEEAEARRRVTGPIPAGGLGRAFDLDALFARGPSRIDAVTTEEGRAELAERLSAARAAIGESRRAAPTPTVTAAAPPVATLLGELVREALASGRSLAGRDLSGADLAGADLTGADLEGAMLERADLRGARLVRVRCAGATFAGASLTGADLSAADLTGANLAEADAKEANFEEAVLTGAQLMKAILDGAHFRRADLRKVQAIETRLAGARLPEVVLDEALLVKIDGAFASFLDARCRKTRFVQAVLADADFMQATLVGAVFLAVVAPRARFTAADLSGALVTSGSTLHCAILRRVQATASGWHGVDLGGADLTGATLDGADLGEAILTGASLRRASLRRAILTGAELSDAVLDRADLLDARLAKATLARADFRGANLYAADVAQATLDETRVRDANVARTRLRR